MQFLVAIKSTLSRIIPSKRDTQKTRSKKMNAQQLIQNKDFFAMALVESIKLMAQKSGKTYQELHRLYQKQEKGFMEELVRNINACAEITAKSIA